MAVQVTLELPDDVFSILRISPDSFAQELRLAAAVMWYDRGKISQGKAAELAGISRSAFLDALGRYHVSPFQVTPEELEQELASE